MIAYSAGSGSVLEFARRHPERVIGLILACCRLGGGITTPRAFAPIFRLAYSADRAFWIFQKDHAERVRPDDGEAEGIGPRHGKRRRSADMLFPLKPRREGAVFDGFVEPRRGPVPPRGDRRSDADHQRQRRHVVRAYRFAVQAAARIPGAKLVSIESGGHWFLGHDAEVRKGIGVFVQEATVSDRRRSSSVRTRGEGEVVSIVGDFASS